ncbi:hypothetical protein D3C72_2312260 [compost metagenome]
MVVLFWNRFSPTQDLMSARRNQIARPQRSGALPAVKTICSSARMRSTSCGWISGLDASCLDRVREDPRAWKPWLTWSISTVVVPQRREM